MMEYKEGKKVVTADGKKIGSLERVVLDPHTKKVTYLVISTGAVFGTDKVVPVEMIANASEDEIRLNVDKDALGPLPEFLQEHYVYADASSLSNEVTYESPATHAEEGVGKAYGRNQLGGGVVPFYWYPPYGTSLGGYAGFAPPTTYPANVEIEENIPEGDVPLKEGADVYTSDNKYAGAIDKVLTDDDSKITHFVIEKGVLFQHEKLIPADWIKAVGEDRVQLDVSSRELEKVPEYKG